MKRITTGKNYVNLIEERDGKIVSQLGFGLAELNYKIEKDNIKFFLKHDYFYKNMVWSADLPLNINGDMVDGDEIGDAMGQLFSAVEQGVTSINGQKGDVFMTVNDLGGLTEREIENLLKEERQEREKEDEKLSEKIDNLSEKHDTELKELEEKHDEDIQKIEKSLEEVNQELGDINQNITNIENNITNIEQQLQEGDTNIENIQNDLTEIHEDINQLQEDINNFKSELQGEINEAKQELEGKINEVDGKVSQLTERVSQIEQEALSHLKATNIKAGANIYVRANGNDVTISTTGIATSESLSSLESTVGELRQQIEGEATQRGQMDGQLQQSIEDIQNSLTGYVNNAEYVKGDKKIYLKHDTTNIASIDTTDFVKDGMVDSVVVEDGFLVITFNTDAEKEEIKISIEKIFKADNYYTKEELDEILEGKQEITENIFVYKVQVSSDGKMLEILGRNSKNASGIDMNEKIGFISINGVRVLGSDTNLSLAEKDSVYTKEESDGKYQTKEDATSVHNQLQQSIDAKADKQYVDSKVSEYTYDKETIDQKVADAGKFDASQYYTKNETYSKSEVDSMIENVDVTEQLSDYAKKTDIPSLEGYATEKWVEDKHYLTEHQSLDEYAKTEDVNQTIENKLENYFTKEEVNQAISEAEVDAYTKAETDNLLGQKQDKLTAVKDIVFVEQLPQNPQSGILYLIPED